MQKEIEKIKKRSHKAAFLSATTKNGETFSSIASSSIFPQSALENTNFSKDDKNPGISFKPKSIITNAQEDMSDNIVFKREVLSTSQIIEDFIGGSKNFFASTIESVSSPEKTAPDGTDNNKSRQNEITTTENNNNPTVVLKTPRQDAILEENQAVNKTAWLQSNFPKAIPATRKDVIDLELHLNEELQVLFNKRHKYRDYGQFFRAVQNLFSFCVHEIIKQTSIECVERGKLLGKIWVRFASNQTILFFENFSFFFLFFLYLLKIC